MVFGKKKVDMGFAVPVIWREQRDHIMDCYFCSAKAKDYPQRNRKKILYPNLPSALLPVPYSADLPVVPITPPYFPELKSESAQNFENSNRDFDNTYPLNQEATKPYLTIRKI